MMRTTSYAVGCYALLAGVSLLGCSPARESNRVSEALALGPPDSSTCELLKRRPLDLDRDARGGFSLNGRHLDSAAFITWVRGSLASFPHELRVVSIRPSISQDRRSLEWLIPVLTSVGARAVAAQPSCVPPPVPAVGFRAPAL
jgi:hypothetical protein